MPDIEHIVILVMNFEICSMFCKKGLKSGYLVFIHLTELENIYITEIYMKKEQ